MVELQKKNMIYALIVAAGKGVRVGGDAPKQFLSCANEPILVRTIKAFQNNKNIDQIIVVTSAQYMALVNDYVKSFNLNKVTDVVLGASTRQLSVFNGLEFIAKKETSDEDYVLIHDGARPLISETIIDNNCKALKNHDCVCTVIKNTNTTYFSKDGAKIDSIMNRDQLYFAQTPQSFRFKTIYELHKNAYQNNIIDSTDDAQLAQIAQKEIFLVEGSNDNIKITTKEDIKIAEAILNSK